MKTVLAKTCVAAACVWLTAGGALAQNMYIAEQQAKRVSAKNDAEQQRIASETGNAGGATAPVTAAPMDPALQATLKNVAGLQSDFASVVASADASDPAQKVSLMNDLTQAAAPTKKATADTVKKVAEDLQAALAGKKALVAAQQTKLAREVHALFNSSRLTATQQQTLLADVQKILTTAGAPLDAAVNTVTDLKTVVAETK